MDQHLGTQIRSHPHRQQPAKPLPGPQRDAQKAQDQDYLQAEHSQGPQQPGLFGDRRQDVVHRPVGEEVVAVLRTFVQSEAGDPSRSDRHQGLPRLVGRVPKLTPHVGVIVQIVLGPREVVPPHPDPVLLILVHPERVGQDPDPESEAEDDKQAAQRSPGRVAHRQQHRPEDQGAAQIRLLEHQYHRHRGDGDRDQQAVERPRLALEAQVAGQGQDHRRLGKLGWLQGDTGKEIPASRAVDQGGEEGQ